MQPVRILTSAAGALLLLPALAFARPGPPAGVGGPPQGGDCADAVVITAHAAYVSCAGAFAGNINGSAGELTDLASYFGGTNWMYKGKSDDGANGPFANAGVAGAQNYLRTYTFDSAISGPFVIGIKQATFYSYYLFNSLVPLASIELDSRGTIAGNQQGFSHVNLYTMDMPTTTAPEPATVVLMGTALFGVGLVARRRRLT